jgi:hypothetical protein
MDLLSLALFSSRVEAGRSAQPAAAARLARRRAAPRGARSGSRRARRAGRSRRRGARAPGAPLFCEPAVLRGVSPRADASWPGQLLPLEQAYSPLFSFLAHRQGSWGLCSARPGASAVHSLGSAPQRAPAGAGCRQPGGSPQRFSAALLASGAELAVLAAVCVLRPGRRAARSSLFRATPGRRSRGVPILGPAVRQAQAECGSAACSFCD